MVLKIMLGWEKMVSPSLTYGMSAVNLGFYQGERPGAACSSISNFLLLRKVCSTSQAARQMMSKSISVARVLFEILLWFCGGGYGGHHITAPIQRLEDSYADLFFPSTFVWIQRTELGWSDFPFGSKCFCCLLRNIPASCLDHFQSTITCLKPNFG